MGGRGIIVGDNNRQVSMEHYAFRQEIEQIRNKWEAYRGESSPQTGAQMAGINLPLGAGIKPLLKRCACCEKFTLQAYSTYEVCPVCGWIDDPKQNADELLTKGANKLSLSEARKKWLDKGTSL